MKRVPSLPAGSLIRHAVAAFCMVALALVLTGVTAYAEEAADVQAVPSEDLTWFLDLTEPLTADEEALYSQAYAYEHRTTAPEADNKWYYSELNPYCNYEGLAPSPYSTTGYYVIGNCTWYAWGRASEVMGHAADIGQYDPEGTLNYVTYKGNYEIGYEPKSRSLAIVNYNGGWHTAFVEEVVNGELIVSESAYRTSDYWPGHENVVFVYGKMWQPQESVVAYIYLPIASEGEFVDVPSSHWAKKVIARAVKLGIFSGYSNGSFGPEDNVTRGQVAVTLWNLAGKPRAGKGAKEFSDVANGAYYAKAVAWASAKGVVSGYGNGSFGPNDNVTREQLAVMLSNYYRYVGKHELDGSAEDFASMADASEVAGYARGAVGWCFKHKVMSGSGGYVNPKGNATRAESAKMLVFMKDLLK